MLNAPMLLSMLDCCHMPLSLLMLRDVDAATQRLIAYVAAAAAAERGMPFAIFR